MNYLHGALGQIVTASEKAAVKTSAAPLYVGTAPVHTLPNGKSNLNKPVLVNSFSEAVKYFGYSEDWAKYTLCEAIYAHFALKAVGPIILVNVLDVDANKAATATTASKTPANGKIVLESAESIILDSISITDKVAGTDYTTAYDYITKRLTITEKTSGGLGTSALTVSYYVVDATGVESADVIGESDELGLNTGLYCVRDVYQKCGLLPNALLAPGWSATKTVRDAMAQLSQQVNGHWDMLFYDDLPLVSGSDPVTMATASTWKTTNGYNANNERAHYPMWAGSDGRYYHLSVLDALNRQELMANNGNLPYETSSNTEMPVSGKLFFGAGIENCPDDGVINEKLTKNGIVSAAFVGGKWVLWGAHTASYSPDNANAQNESETNLAMLYYISNDFQVRRSEEVDKPMAKNRMQQITAEETARIDALVAAGALMGGSVQLIGDMEAVADMMNGDFKFAFNVTTMLLSKSLTAYVSYTDAWLVTYFEEV